MKKLALVALLATLAGCATGPNAGLTEARLTASHMDTSLYHRQDRIIPTTFAKLQMALFKQERVCGSAPVFKMEPRQTNYATLTDMPEPSPTYENAVVAKLTQVMATYLAPERVKAEIYSYYDDAATRDRVERLFDAVEYPGVCPGQPRVKPADSDSKAKQG
ncbi:hypothetical protein [Pusillimonas sp. ANT_WB101]|uniref:hypothetical protein n=1 Tax=Pusillimonas sp. ANT_WB101 TaxID=2597356 RepID=UPI0011EEAEEE|nr:hypothetical protein [Pusillimonas sp. ANT_WB101]KAA0888444.1 hypothetical protein FQ179_20980 [Pusillimonas sp. ANT_WB101]